MHPVTTAARPSVEERIRAALWFAERGFGVFSVWSTDADGACRCPLKAACENPGKHPIPQIGFKAATTDPAKIRAMLSAGSEPNWGMLPAEGVFALDVDGQGVARLAELETLHGPLPPTLRTSTAHGQHIFLRWPTALPRPIGQLFGFVTRWGSGTNAGYVVGPRSVHATGAVYAPAGDVYAIADLPDAWARAAVAPGSPGTPEIVIRTGYQLPDQIPAGASRYGEILRYTAHLYDTSRLSVAEMWPLVHDVLAPRFEQPLTEQELRSRFDRAVDRMPERLGDRRHIPPEPVDPSTFPEPENRGQARMSELGNVEYVEDLVRPGRIVVWAAEEGSGKSYAVAGELAIRVAAAGGSFAETWPVVRQGRVLVLSEMHPDDDYVREEIVLSALGLDRTGIDGRYFRLDLMRAAGGRPALTVPEWRTWITGWLREHEVLLMVVDTATGATQVDPWGREIQTVYASLRMMLAEHPELAVILIVHVRKPTGRGEARQLSDVLGEWGRWCDVVVLQENDGTSLERTRLTTRKRVDRQRRVVATKVDGLLRDVVDLDGIVNAKVPEADVLRAIETRPGLTFAELGEQLGVAKDTAKRYAARLGRRVRVESGREFRVYLAEPSESDRRTAKHGPDAALTSTKTASTHGDAQQAPGQEAELTDARSSATHQPRASVEKRGAERRTPPPHLKVGEGASVGRAVLSAPGAQRHVGASVADEWCLFFRDHQTRHRNVSADPWCEICTPRTEVKR